MEKARGMNDEAEECNTWKRSKPANVAKGNWEPATEVIVENCERKKYYLLTFFYVRPDDGYI